MKVPSQTSKLYAAGLFLLALALLVFVQAAFNLNPIISPSQPNQIVLLFTLSTFIFLVLLIFGFVLLRAVVKVWAERKQQKPGSKFKTTVLVSLVTLTLLPATCLFMFAFALLNQIGQEFGSLDDTGADTLSRLSRIRQTFQLDGLIVLDNDGNIVRSDFG